MSTAATVDYSEKIPNNVDLASDRRLQRALESWQPKFLQWWRDLGPVAFQDKDVYLRTAISTDQEGWATITKEGWTYQEVPGGGAELHELIGEVEVHRGQDRRCIRDTHFVRRQVRALQAAFHRPPTGVVPAPDPDAVVRGHP
jgi:hypothetical protein